MRRAMATAAEWPPFVRQSDNAAGMIPMVADRLAGATLDRREEEA